jgi:hypothetical protein
MPLQVSRVATALTPDDDWAEQTRHQVFGFDHHAALNRNASRLTFGRSATNRPIPIAIVCGHRSAIENEIFALLIQHSETIQPQRIPK